MSQSALIGVPSPRPYEPPPIGQPMDVEEWQTCDNPRQMLQAVCGRITDRTLRVFAVACARRVWHLFHDERARIAIEATEAFLDGTITAEQLAEVKDSICSIPAPQVVLPGSHGTFGAAWYTSGWYSWYAAVYGSEHAAKAVKDATIHTLLSTVVNKNDADFDELISVGDRAEKIERIEQAALLRRLVSNTGDAHELINDNNNMIYMKG